jgi:hypothetical protein
MEVSQIGGHSFDCSEPRAYNRSVRLGRANADLRAKMQIAYLAYQSLGSPFSSSVSKSTKVL